MLASRHLNISKTCIHDEASSAFPLLLKLATRTQGKYQILACQNPLPVAVFTPPQFWVVTCFARSQRLFWPWNKGIKLSQQELWTWQRQGLHERVVAYADCSNFWGPSLLLYHVNLVNRKVGRKKRRLPGTTNLPAQIIVPKIIRVEQVVSL